MSFDGRKWRARPAPKDPGMPGELAADGHGGLWWPVPAGVQVAYAHWNGKTWSETRAKPAPDSRSAILNGIALIPGTRTVLAAGAYGRTDDANTPLLQVYGPFPGK